MDTNTRITQTELIVLGNICVAILLLTLGVI